MYNNIYNTRFDGQTPFATIPVVNIASDAMAVGTLTLSEPVDYVGSVDVSVYRVLTPSGASDQWSHADTTNHQLLVVPPVAYTWYQQFAGPWVISWQYNASVISDSSSGNYYSIEWAINKMPTPAVIQSSPKIIMHIKDSIV
jgi:hypothetical protein